MAKRVRYKVRGRSVFPIDMLRYDQSFPADGNAAANIQRYSSLDRPRESVEIELITTQDHVTGDRWASFGWYVQADSLSKETW